MQTRAQADIHINTITYICDHVGMPACMHIASHRHTRILTVAHTHLIPVSVHSHTCAHNHTQTHMCTQSHMLTHVCTSAGTHLHAQQAHRRALT